MSSAVPTRALGGLPPGEGGRPDAATAAASWRPTPSWPPTTPASCSAGARRASGCGSSAAADIVDLADPDLLQPPLDRSFKKPGGYVMRDKLAAAREISGQAKPEGALEVTIAAPARRPPWSSCSARWPMTSSSSASATPSGPGSRRILEEDVAMSSLAAGRDRPRGGALRSPRRADRGGSRRHRLRPPTGGLPSLPPARPRAGRLGDDDRAPLPLRHRGRRASRRPRRRFVGAARGPRRQARPRGALPPDARGRLAGPAG